MRDAVDPWTAAVRLHARIGHAIEVHERIGSTNDRARDLFVMPGGPGSVVIAEEQVAGRGRRGRTWQSPPGRNLTFSVPMHPRLAAVDGWQLGLAVGLAVHGACAALDPSVALKWPNDLVASDGRKLGGLLIETVIDGERLSGAVVGIGLNVNWRHDEMPAELAAFATSLADLLGADVDRVALLRSVLDGLERELAAVEAGWSPLVRYRTVCETLGAFVSVETQAGRVEGRAVEVDDTGALVVETSAGRVPVSGGNVEMVRRMVRA
ncbi:bifunctional biotin--[acetyl-CoA-carboxylase] synthetase/biotin operon repressor [soil metagenome]